MEDVSEKEIEHIFGMEGVDLSSILLPGVERGDDTEDLQMYIQAVKEDRRMYVVGVCVDVLVCVGVCVAVCVGVWVLVLV